MLNSPYPVQERIFQAIQAGLAAIHSTATVIPDPDALTVSGQGVLESAYPVTDMAAASIGSSAVALAAYMGSAFGSTPKVSVDRRLSSLWFDRSLRPLGWRIPPARDPVTGDYQGLDGWIRIHANAPHHRDCALQVLKAEPSRQSVAQAVAQRRVEDLETELVAANACAACMRTRDQWAHHPQGLAVAQAPLFLVDTGMHCNDEPRAGFDPGRPLAGLRVLDLTRVLAGPVSTRFLAGYGAQVLRIDPPTWSEPGVVPEVTLGKYCAGLDLKQPSDHKQFKTLLAQADVLVHGYRPGALDGLGLGADARQQIRPGLIDVSLNAYGWAGPWSSRRGFDSLVQMSCGIADVGMHWKSRSVPTPLPVQALDHTAGYLIAAAVLHGLIRRRHDGRGSIVRLALARVAHLLISENATDESIMAPLAPTDFDTRTEEKTAWGPGQRLKVPCMIEGSPMHWARGAGELRAEDAKRFFLP